jgi:hypothetical protein
MHFKAGSTRNRTSCQTIEPVWAAIPRTLDYTGALLMPINLRQAPVPSDLVPSGLPGPVRIMREE